MNKRSIYIIIPFVVIIMFFNIASLIVPDKTKSTVENRTLAKKPTAIDLQNGSFPNKYEKYFNDHLVLRDQFTHLSVVKDLILNKTNINNKYVIDNKDILEEPTKRVSSQELSSTINKVTKFKQEVEQLDKDFIYIMTPRKTTIQQYLFPNYIQSLQKDLEQPHYFLKQLEDNDIATINILDYYLTNFTEQELEEFYFRTDHHWNSIGAYNAFKYIISEVSKLDHGIEYTIKDEDYKTTIVDNIKFLGSHNKQLFEEIPYEKEIPYVHLNKECVKQYFLLENNQIKEVNEKKIFAKNINKNGFITYADAYTDDLTYYKIINKDFKIDKKIIIFKDSYQNAMTLLLSDIFKEVEVVDVRHTGKKPAINFVKESNANIVWIMYNNRNLGGNIFNLI